MIPLEPSALKAARSVLRGERSSNAPDLPDKQDLFGEWLILRSWGDVRSQRGRQMENRCNDLTEAKKAFKEVVKRRQYRKYKLVSQY